MEFLDDEIWFPTYDCADESGIIAVGGDLSTERLELAYKLGIFPWFNPDDPIIWWFPNPRFVLFPNELHVSKSMKKVLRDEIFTITENQDFESVIDNCSKIHRKGQGESWITDEMREAYINLHQKGMAKSVEVWQNNELVGGFYGVDCGHVFCGESMFAKVSNASKAGFITFVQKYKDQFELIDCQVYTQHLESLGAKEIDANLFLEILHKE